MTDATYLILATLSFSTMGCLFSAPGYGGPQSAHFDGKRFHNQVERQRSDWRDFWKWQSNRKRGQWSAYRSAPPGPPPPNRVEMDRLRVTFVNHATALIQMDGVNILTDPIWSERCSPVSFAGPRRVRPPGIRFEDLPPIDLVLVSHNHYDHMDIATLRRLDAAYHPSFYVGLGNREFLKSNGLSSVVELDWWQERQFKQLNLVSVPSQHFSNRGLTDSDKTLWTGFAVIGRAGYVYFAGDTGWGPHFEQIRARLGNPRLALLPIGAFLPEWFMSRAHVSPEQALEAHKILRASASMAIHFGTFELGDDGETEASDRLLKAVAASRPVQPFWILDFGEGRDVPPAL